MDNKKDNIDKVESVSTIIVNIGMIVSWVLSIFTAFVLTSQPQPISLPGILELDASYKLIFLTSIFLAYIQLLRRSWVAQKRTANEIEGSFGSYVYGSVIKFKRPLVSIGFLVILGLFLIIAFTEASLLGALILIGGLIAIFSLAFIGPEVAIKIKRTYDDEFRKRWLKRVKKQLYQNGYTHTWALPQKVDSELRQVAAITPLELFWG